MMFNQYNDLLNVEELCEVLNIGKNLAYELLSVGDIKGLKIGRTWKIPKASIEQYIIVKSGLIKQ